MSSATRTNPKTVPNRVALLGLVPPNGRCCEIGVLAGCYTEHILRVVRPRAFYAVDAWEHSRPIPTRVDGAFRMLAPVDAEPIFRDRFADPIADGRVTVVRGRSPAVLDAIPAGGLDFAYVDGEHDYDSVLADLEGVLPKMREGGLIAGHDHCLIQRYGVVRAVAVFCDRWGLTLDYLTDEKPMPIDPLPWPTCPREIAFNSFGILVR